MPDKSKKREKGATVGGPDENVGGLKQLAKLLKLSTSTLSLVLNDAPSAVSIPQETKDRIFAAAKELNYRPNYLARSLRVQRTHTFGVIVPELSDGYSSMVLNGVESILTGAGYFFLTASHLNRTDLREKLLRLMMERQVEGLIAVNTPIRSRSNLPVVSVSGHEEINGVTNVVLNHITAAELGIGHLYDLGHRRIAVFKGQEFSSDTEIRWAPISQAAKRRGIEIDSRLIVQLEGDSTSPEPGYNAAKALLERGVDFTALFAFNDISAIGAIRALQETGRCVPEDVSVLGFDDIYAAAFNSPRLTTIRQPLLKMGILAAEALLEMLGNGVDPDRPHVLTVEPDLVLRNSTASVRTSE